MSAEKKSILKRAKTFIISVLLMALIIESVVLYRLYKVNVADTVIALDESGELFSVEADINEKISKLRNLFKDSSAQAWAKAQKTGDPEDAWFNMGYRPRADFRETDQSYTVSIDIPGVKPAELSATLNGLSLTISGVRNQSKKAGELHVRERFRGEFSRTFDIPGKIAAEGIKAGVSDGVLRILIPKGNSDDLDIPIEISSIKLMLPVSL